MVRFALGCNIKTQGDRCGNPDYSATPENHHQDARCANQEQVALVKHLESLGFDEAWVTEQHFSESNLRTLIFECAKKPGKFDTLQSRNTELCVKWLVVNLS
ncbi:hypothetical protein PCC6912_49620 [Chlorogloeopsis fritschii PCC 6912]|uniref:Uncharacterized protein n=1 Tax=Chlorogloeopsis fritschii PCC 6912 TaxID=211165 RepID=A0A433N249_CHLFR|nr:hypothetical protein PCC6912_49620 [Chlorogloeopsis fritschii PCC 6912]